jgi:hypothetical protein
VLLLLLRILWGVDLQVQLLRTDVVGCTGGRRNDQQHHCRNQVKAEQPGQAHVSGASHSVNLKLSRCTSDKLAYIQSCVGRPYETTVRVQHAKRLGTAISRLANSAC